jgi:hypothetical protein
MKKKKKKSEEGEKEVEKHKSRMGIYASQAGDGIFPASQNN